MDGRVVYHPGLEEERAYSSGLQAYLCGEDLNECISVEGEVIAVGKDVAIAEWMRGRSQAGLTVRGEAFHRVMEDNAPLRPGRGVGVSEDGKKCFSLHYGYAILTGQNLQVLPLSGSLRINRRCTMCIFHTSLLSRRLARKIS